MIAGELRAVAVPSVEAESLRDLVRAREVVHARPARARKSERTPALAGIRQMRPRGFEPPRTIRSTRPSTMAPPHRWVAIPLARAVSALHVARSFAQLGPRIGAGLAGQFRDARGAPVAGTAGDKRAAISETTWAYAIARPASPSKRRSRCTPTGGRQAGVRAVPTQPRATDRREVRRALPDRPRWEVGPAGEQTASSVDSVDGESGFGCRLDELHDVGRVGDHRQMP